MTRSDRCLIALVAAGTTACALAFGADASTPSHMAHAGTATTPPAAHDAAAAAADASAAASTSASRVAGEDDAKLMLVMDSSGSMADPAGGGLSKIEAAQESLNTVIDTLPSDQELGLRVYGAQVRGESDPNACTDSQLVVPVGSGNRDVLRDAVDGYKPVGATPIGYALQQASGDLGGKGRRNIILVSDGESTCQPDPCVVARQLRADGVDLRVDVVGLNVAGAARNQLKCVANSGGGVYYDAHDPGQLTDSLTKLTERAARPYETIGQPVTGAKNYDNAPTLRAGDWLDELPQPKGVYDGQRVYKIKRQLAESSLFVSAAYRAPDGVSNLELSLSAPDGTECSSSFDSQLFTDGMLLSVGAAAGQLGEENQPIEADDPCLTSRKLAAVVTYSDTERPVPVELRVTERPEITNLDDLDEPTETPRWESPEAGSGDVTGGTSFGNAEPLEPGGYRGTIVPGETLTYAVDVDWGEQLNVAAHLEHLTGALGQAVAGQPSIYLQIFGPARLSAGTTEASTDLAADATLGDGGSDDLGLTTGQVTYPNIGYRPGAAQAGSYTITLYLEDNGDNASLPVPYDLGIGVTGEATNAPAYDEQAFGATDTAPADAGNDDTGDAAAPPTDPDTTGGEGVSPLAWIIGLALLAAIAFLLLRMRQQRTPAAGAPGGVSTPSGTPPRAGAPPGAETRRRSTRLAHRVLNSARDIIRSNPTVDTVSTRETQPAATPTSTPSRPARQTPADRPSPSHTPAPAAADIPKHASAGEVLDAAHGHGLGLTGPGAAAAARTVLLNLLGGHAGEVEVLIPARDLAHLLDGHALEQASPAQLSTAASLETALNWLETKLVARTRQTEDRDERNGPETAGPPPQPRIVLLTRPAPGAQQRLAAVLDNGARLGITGIILGPWQPDHTITIGADGTIASPPASTNTPLLRARLSMTSTSHTMHRLAELATADPAPRISDSDDESETNPAISLYRLEILNPAHPEPDRPATGSGETPERDTRETTAVPTAALTTPPLKLSVFGPPMLIRRTDGRDMNLTMQLGARQLELLCYLALHPNGARRDTIADTLWPDSPVDRPANALQKTAQRLRSTLAEATDDAVTESLLIYEGIYRLDPDIVAVDYWEFATAVTAGRTATDPVEQQNADQQVLAVHTGLLADGLDLEWIDTPRRTAQRDAINAVSRLAQHIVDDQPGRTLDLLEAARLIAPDNEAIYRDIMRLQHKLGRAAAIGSTLDLLTTCMAEVDAEPGPDTIQLAHRLQQQPSQPTTR